MIVAYLRALSAQTEYGGRYEVAKGVASEWADEGPVIGKDVIGLVLRSQ